MEDNEAVVMLIASNCTRDVGVLRTTDPPVAELVPGLMSADVFSYAFTTLDLMLLSEQPFEEKKIRSGKTQKVDGRSS
jgi:hypothetical protein